MENVIIVINHHHSRAVGCTGFEFRWGERKQTFIYAPFLSEKNFLMELHGKINDVALIIIDQESTSVVVRR